MIHPEGKRYYKDTHGLKKTSMDEDALKIIHRLNRFGHKAYLVGGCIRDLLLEKRPKDFDIATSATPNQIKNIFNNCRIIGKRFRIVHVLFKGKIIEVSTFRSLPDHRFQAESSKDTDILLKKDNNFGNAKEDAARRDFTINALYYDPRSESIIDFVGGYEDIKNKLVRVVGDPEISFREDPVRMLRAVKISVLHNLQLDKKTSLAIKKNRIEIEKASSSRMLEEYNKIFRTMESAIIFKGLAENHLMEVLFKEPIDLLKKDPDWLNKFLDKSIGLRLAIADRKMKEREELTPVIFYSLIFSDVVTEALENKKGNMVPIIKEALEPICRRLEIPKRDKDRLIKTFACQKRFKKKVEGNSAQNELFKSKDYFYDAFMYFKINAEAEQDEEGVQAAFFWEISTRIRPQSTSLIRGGRFEKKRRTPPGPGQGAPQPSGKNRKNDRSKDSENSGNREQNRDNNRERENKGTFRDMERSKLALFKADQDEQKKQDQLAAEKASAPEVSPLSGDVLPETTAESTPKENEKSPYIKKKKKYKPRRYKKYYKKGKENSGESGNSNNSTPKDVISE